ncbi:MAG TPA: DUF6314 family protein [Thermohalobaculum sp.]|nr:DUF6314 family protein [Thermohalobaculum sp.]
MAMTIATEGWFRGQWQMVRIIENVPEGVIGEFWGECSFAPDGDGLTCDEKGVLRFRGADFHSGRVSLWRFPGQGRIEVHYEDGRPFHDFVADKPEATHLCGDDYYRVSYDFGPEGDRDSWVSRWQVVGPRKDYVMATRYRRIGDSSR